MRRSGLSPVQQAFALRSRFPDFCTCLGSGAGTCALSTASCRGQRNGSRTTNLAGDPRLARRRRVAAAVRPARRPARGRHQGTTDPSLAVTSAARALNRPHGQLGSLASCDSLDQRQRRNRATRSNPVARSCRLTLATAGIRPAVPAGVATAGPHHPPAALGALLGVLERIEECGLPGRCHLHWCCRRCRSVPAVAIALR
jgi:hypothetical protein